MDSSDFWSQGCDSFIRPTTAPANDKCQFFMDEDSDPENSKFFLPEEFFYFYSHLPHISYLPSNHLNCEFHFQEKYSLRNQFILLTFRLKK